MLIVEKTYSVIQVREIKYVGKSIDLWEIQTTYFMRRSCAKVDLLYMQISAYEFSLRKTISPA